MKRRQILLALGGLGAAASGYAWHERRGLTRADLGAEETPRDVSSPVLSLGVRAILEYASLAPSGHNAQPWTVRVGDGELRIGTDRLRWLQKVDPSNREVALSVGAFLENLLVAAPSHGYSADYTVTGSDAASGELLQVSLKKIPISHASLESLSGRRTVRSGQMPKSLSGDDVRRLTAFFDNEAHFVSPGTAPLTKRTESSSQVRLAPRERHCKK